MAEHDWKQLLDDPEIEGVIRRVRLNAGRRFYWRPVQAMAYDDLESWLWDKAVDIAIRYARHEFTTDMYDADRHWKSWLYTALSKGIYRGEHLVSLRGKEGSAKRETEMATLMSVELHHEIAGDVLTAESNSIHHKMTRDDPLAIMLRLEYLDRTLARVTRTATSYVTESNGICSELLCGKPSESLGLCSMHYQRQRRDWNDLCQVEGCNQGIRAKGLCGTHYSALRRDRMQEQQCQIGGCDGSVRDRGYCRQHLLEHPAEARPTHCTVEGCERPHKARGLCDPHYRRALREAKRDAA